MGGTIFLDLLTSELSMARRRSRRKMYKQVVNTEEDLGDSGTQVQIGKLTPISTRNQLGKAYCNNMMITYILQADGPTSDDVGGVVFYVCSSSTFSAEDVITARALPYGGGSINLPVKAWVSGETFDDMPGGTLYIFAESTDTSLSLNVKIRYTAEVWGSALLQYNIT